MKPIASALVIALGLLAGLVGLARAQASDTTVVFGPTEYIKVGSGTWVDYTDEYSSALVPGRRYVLVVTNGAGSHGHVSKAVISINGQEWVGSGECTSGIDSLSRTVDVADLDNGLGISLSGSANSAISVRIYHVPDSTFAIYSRTTFTKPSPAAAQYAPVTIPTGAGPPYTLRVINGQPFGTNRTANCAVDLKQGSNVRSVIGSSEFTTGIASFTRTIGLLSPDSVRITNNGATSSRVTVWVAARDTLRPTLTVDAPVDNFGTAASSITASGLVQDQTYKRLKINGQTVTLAGDGTFSTSLNLGSEGNNVFTFVAIDAAGNSTSVTRNLLRDQTKPALAVSTPANGLTTANTSVSVDGVVTDAHASLLTVNGEGVDVAPNGTFSYEQALSCGSNVIVIRALDAYGNDSTLTRNVIRTITGLAAPNAPTPTALDPTVVPAFKRSHTFLYQFPGGVQRGVDPDQVDDQRVAVVRGHIVLGDGTTPLAGAKIRVLDHPELGYTVSRNDGGAFDLVVNGGGGITLSIERAGFLPVQRTIEVPWRDYLNLPPIGMIGLDTEVRTIVSADTIQIARSSERTDALGARRSFLMFKPGTGATLRHRDGSTQALTSYSVRASEYTQGPGGPSAMPAELPASSAYTYCLELSVDEADSNTSRVDLSQSVPLYLTNYRHFPPGIDVPVGWYDRESSVWKAEPNGRVIKVLSVGGGIASLDLDDDAVADTGAALVALEIDTPERERIATLFAAGDTVIRAPIQHFSTHDLNHAWWFPFGAIFPGLDTLKLGARDCDCPTKKHASIIENESQVLGETVPIVGTPFTLNYRSSRAVGYAPAREIEIPLADAFPGGIPPASLLRIAVVVHIAGQTIEENFAPSTQSSDIIAWDGNDVYGRPVQGRQVATVSLGYVYERQFVAPQPGQTQTNPLFGLFCGQTGCRRLQSAESEAVAWSTIRVPLGSQQMRAAGLGGWSLNEHHVYDPTGDGVLLMGNGDQVTGGRLSPIMSPLVTGLAANDIAIDPKSKDLIVGGNYRIYRVHSNGAIDSIAGTGVPPASNNGPGDGGPATSAQLRTDEVAVGPDGSIYVVDQNRIRRIWPDGIIRTIAGLGSALSQGDDGLAVDAYVSEPNDIKVGPDGAVFLSEGGNPGFKVRRIGPEGYITRYAGTGSAGYNDGDSLAASSAFSPAGLALDESGSLYVANGGNRLRVVRPDGKVGLIAGDGGGAFGVEGGAATSTSLLAVDEVTVGPDHAVYFTENLTNASGGSTGRIRRVGGDGIITTVAGGVEPFSSDNSPARSQALNYPLSIAFDGEGRLLADVGGTIYAIRPPAPGFTLGEVVWPSRDGSEYYVFSADGKHLRTHDAYTNAVRFTFNYDENGLLKSIYDMNGDSTRIQRFGSDSLAIIGPYDHRTALILASGGTLLANVRNPAGESRSFTYASGTGLLDIETHPRSQQQDFDFENGRLVTDHDAAGGEQSLSRTGTPRTYTVTRTALGLSTRYTATDALNGDVGRRVETPDGLAIVSTESRSGVTTSTYLDGSSSTLKRSPDLRFGMRAPYASSLSITVPGISPFGLTASRSTYATGLALTSQTDEVTVNSRLYSSEFVRDDLTFTDQTPESRTLTTRVDAAGRPQCISIGGLDSITYRYDARGRLETTGQGGRVWTYTYDDSGRVKDITDGKGRQTRFRYDAADRLIRQTLADNEVIGYDYDASGNLKALTPPGKPTHNFGYTPVDLDASYGPPPESDIADPQTRYQWRADRRLQRVNRPDGATINLHYDAYGRPDSVDTPLGNVGFHYDTHGRVDQVEGIPADNVTLDYDYAGSLPTREEWSGALAGAVEHPFDAFFRPTTQTVKVGAKVSATTNGYDLDGLLTSVALPTGGSYGLHRRTVNGLLDSTRVGPVVTEHGYNGKGELASQIARLNNTVLFSQVFTRDTLGRIQQIVETELGDTHTWDYTYETSGRLDEVRLDNVLVGSYDYDGNGNRTDVTENSVSTTASHDDQDRLRQRGSRILSYAANGELTAERAGADSTLYRYDVLGNLRWAKRSTGDSVEYVIDGQNRRVIRKQNGTITRRWLYQNGLDPIAELDGSGVLLNRFVYGSQRHVPDLLIRTTGAADTVYRLVTDHLGSVRLVVNTVTGTIAQRIDYDAWGQETTNSSLHWQSLSYAGGIAEPLTKLVRFGARDYAASQGRWTAKDPIRFAASDNNAYAYVQGDPINESDPLGLWTVGGGVSGGAAIAGWGVNGAITVNVGKDPALGILDGWSVSVAVTGAGGASGGLGIGIGYLGQITDARDVSGLDGRFFEAGRGALGPKGLGGIGYEQSPDGRVHGVLLSISDPRFTWPKGTYIGPLGGASETRSLKLIQGRKCP